MSESLASIFEGQTNERVKRMGKKIPKVDAGPRDLGFRSYSYICGGTGEGAIYGFSNHEGKVVK